MMKKDILVFSLLVIFSTAIFAQEEPTKMRPKDRLIIGLFTDIWSGLPDNMDPEGLNRGIALDYIQEFPISTSNFSVAAGLGFVSHNLYSDNFYKRDNDRFEFTPIGEEFGGVEYSNNKLSLNYLNIPLEVRFRTRNTPKTFRIHAGVKAGLLVNAHTKYVGDSSPNGHEMKRKEGKLDNIENFMLGFHSRIGYGRINLHYFMNLTSIFEGNNAEDANIMSLGVSFILF